MSRSYRKVPIHTDSDNGHKWAKNQANRKVRHTKIVGQFGDYKKLYEQWRIVDCRGGWYSWKEVYNCLVKEAEDPDVGRWGIFRRRTFWSAFWKRITK